MAATYTKLFVQTDSAISVLTNLVASLCRGTVRGREVVGSGLEFDVFPNDNPATDATGKDAFLASPFTIDIDANDIDEATFISAVGRLMEGLHVRA